MPDGTLQRKTAILVDAPRSIRTPPASFAGRPVESPARALRVTPCGVATGGTPSGSRKKVFGA